MRGSWRVGAIGGLVVMLAAGAASGRRTDRPALARARVEAAPALPTTTAYSCGFLPTRRAETARATPAAEVMQRLAHPAGEPLAAVVERAAALEPSTLDLRTRIVLQNQLLALDWSAPELAAVQDLGRGLMLALAIPGPVLDALGSEPETGVTAYVGPTRGWIERRGPSCGVAPLIHERLHGGVLGFRPVRTAALHALIAQRVAIDTEGHPHLTPLVAKLELRGGAAASPAACVLEYDPGTSQPAGLRAVPLAELPQTKFVFRDGDGVGCYRCHEPDGARMGFDDVPGAAAGELLASRQQTLLEYSARRLAAWLAPATTP